MHDVLMDAKVLRRAAEIVDQGWCQDFLALDEHENAVDVQSPRAVRWCALGASILAGKQMGSDGWRAFHEASRTTPTGDRLTIWNNAPGRTADEVATYLRSVADRCENAAR